MKSVNLLGLRIDCVGIDDVIDLVVKSNINKTKLKIFHLNIHAFNISFKDLQFKKKINEADVVFCDGYGVKVGARILNKSIGERMTPPDWIDRLCQNLVLNRQSLFLLGDEVGVAEACAEKLMNKYPNLIIKGTYHGFFNKNNYENDNVISLINNVNPDVLLVGLGMPLQEEWITNNFMCVNANIFISVGAMFKWISGHGRRAPAILSSNGFEGIWRLFTQPHKVWRRYILEVPFFFFKTLAALIVKEKE